MHKCGIAQFWTKDPKVISTSFNAEEAYAKPMFRSPFKSKRRLVLAHRLSWDIGDEHERLDHAMSVNTARAICRVRPNR
jgi:putative SOS response-associated peptidase YedK